MNIVLEEERALSSHFRVPGTARSSTAASTTSSSTRIALFNSLTPSSTALVSECVNSPYRPLPRQLKISWQWNKLRTFFLGNETNSKMFAVSEHSGLSNRTSNSPCLLMHNGPSGKDPILAAAGETLRDGLSDPGVVESIVNVSAAPKAEEDVRVATEIVQALFEEREQAVVFRWGIETMKEENGQDSFVREEFEWCMTPPQAAADPKYCHEFKLYRSGDIRAPLEYLAMASWKEAAWKTCRIEFSDKGIQQNLGERWSLMVLMTALRMWQLGRSGQASLEYVGGR
ncbi:hypothetical protein NW762_001813 [Fusarium torreyae]|uniref:Uncharacterized protein n=1 Tax=Fusarium torreyae TaxID=1237075 RepID=A0A9W8VNT1_9HYPO|nr:hypothetical protein NW762_001813 [Fusarium torreyae]